MIFRAEGVFYIWLVRPLQRLVHQDFGRVVTVGLVDGRGDTRCTRGLGSKKEVAKVVRNIMFDAHEVFTILKAKYDNFITRLICFGISKRELHFGGGRSVFIVDRMANHKS